MIRMKKGPTESNADIVAVIESQHNLDGSTDSLEVAKTAIAITLAWTDGADSWEGWQFVRGGEL